MALREFTTADGRAWRAWDILPEQLDERTRAEDYLQGFLDGWLVFESADGSEKCRLYPIPRGWATASEEELRRFLGQAQSLRPEERAGRSGIDAPPPTPKARTARPGMRTFRYPGGRYWSVHEWLADVPGPADRPAERHVVLRFTSGARRLDLVAFPHGWVDYTDDQLADLLYLAFPRDAARHNPSSHARRRGDARPESGRT